MRKMTVLCFSLFFPSLGFAQASNCDELQDTAHKIMSMYQEGLPVATAIDTFTRSTADSTINKIMIEVAYDTDKFETQEDKEQAAVDFSNHMYMFCLRAY